MKKGILYIAVATVLFASMEVAIKISGSVFNPIQINFIRFLIGGVFLLPFAFRQLKKHNYRLGKKDFAKFLVTGFLVVVVSMSFFTISLHYINASIAAVLFCTNTFFSILLADILIGEKTSRAMKGALLIVFCGIMVLINPFNFQGSLVGFIIILIAAFCFSVYSIVGKILSEETPLGGITMTCFSFLAGVIELGILMGLTHISWISQFFKKRGFDSFADISFFNGVSWENLAFVLFIGIGVTGIGFAAYFTAMDEMSVTMASLAFFIKPVLAPIFAVLVLHEVIAPNQFIGIVLMAIGSTAIFMLNRKAELREVDIIILEEQEEY